MLTRTQVEEFKFPDRVLTLKAVLTSHKFVVRTSSLAGGSGPALRISPLRRLQHLRRWLELRVDPAGDFHVVLVRSNVTMLMRTADRDRMCDVFRPGLPDRTAHVYWLPCREASEQHTGTNRTCASQVRL